MKYLGAAILAFGAAAFAAATGANVAAAQSPASAAPRPHGPRPSHTHPALSSLPYRLQAVSTGTALKTVADIRALYVSANQRTGAQIASITLTTWGAHSASNRRDIADHEIDPTRPVFVVNFTYPNGYHFAGEDRGPDAKAFSVVDAVTGDPLSFEIRGTQTRRASPPPRRP